LERVRRRNWEELEREEREERGRQGRRAGSGVQRRAGTRTGGGKAGAARKRRTIAAGECGVRIAPGERTGTRSGGRGSRLATAVERGGEWRGRFEVVKGC